MNIGFGSLKQMNDTLKYNREILPKRKSAREVYRDEVKKNLSSGDRADLEMIRIRVRERLARDRESEFLRRTATMVIPVIILGLAAWIAFSVDFTTKTKVFQEDKFQFITQTAALPGDIYCKTEYFPSGPKAAETYFIKNHKHFTGYSYYESGEIFRSVDYYYDTLVRETYFFKNGDAIQGFPKVAMDRPQQIEIAAPGMGCRISFDFLDGKIITGSYQETAIEK